MDFNNKTIFELFDGSQKQFIIPVYQRAYSWEKEQLSAFLNDLLEQIEGDNNYFYGNILLETIEKGKKYEIIDGQQRLTTLSLFIRAIINVLRNRETDIDLEEKEKTYIKYGGTIKLRPVEYDRAFYDTIIVENKNKCNILSPSQERIFEAKKYFQTELEKLDTELIHEILNKVENTELASIELTGKKDAALMFELQNNRGKDLTNMEKIKSYFMYQMYVYSDKEQVETNIEYIADIFKSIYQVINDIKILNEDSVLIYHNNAYINGYYYRTLDDVKEKFKKQKDKVKWIKEYVNELLLSFTNIKKFNQLDNDYSQRLNSIGIPAYAWAFIIRGYKYNEAGLLELLQTLEKVIFRAKLINSRANIQERLNAILSNFEGDVSQLNKEIKDKLNSEWYWSDANMKEYLDSRNFYGNRILNYLLWQYESYIQGKGYKIHNIELEKEQIEHISPQRPEEGKLATGYDKYDEEFEKSYLHCLGNLMLISGSHNASIGNKSFKQKLNSYKQNPLLNQQAEIKDFCEEEKWGKEEINKRHKKILDFCMERWKF
ncbi:DUF262 domain-containing protein [Capnocytophaga cynodegmi]|uniref:DUF262 domain-containing protein n=1 Tax=Capnocytophaga cynodegmi TaxID=28189 RepID=A0A0B7H0I0_9FLAO|nr:DUF262 domain-containing protein [Capnocytophaga cynodegmi]CEN33051.1 conserved hypothetical protein [Capnocytophaga cynodegmi]